VVGGSGTGFLYVRILARSSANPQPLQISLVRAILAAVRYQDNSQVATGGVWSKSGEGCGDFLWFTAKEIAAGSGPSSHDNEEFSGPLEQVSIESKAGKEVH
jgi:hypothetical protein